MAELKTKRNMKSVERFLKGVKDAGRREDALKVMALMEELTGTRPEMWGDSIVGFGTYRYKYESGRRVVPHRPFATKGESHSLYYVGILLLYRDSLGTWNCSRSWASTRPESLVCTSNRLNDIDLKVLRRLVKESVAHVRRREKEQIG